MNKLKQAIESAPKPQQEILVEMVDSYKELLELNQQHEANIKSLKDDIRLYKQRLFGSSSESFIDYPKQESLELLDKFELVSDDIQLNVPVKPVTKTGSKSHKRGGAQKLPNNLKREIIVHDIPDQEKQCSLGHDLNQFSKRETEELVIVPPKVFVRRHIHYRYICKTCSVDNANGEDIKTCIKEAPRPPRLFKGSLASPELLAFIIVSIFCDHLPMHRIESLLDRYNISISKQQISNYKLAVSRCVEPLIDLIKSDVLKCNIQFADETTFQVLQEPGKTAQSTSYFWCFAGMKDRIPIYYFQYSPSRSHNVPLDLYPEDFAGAVHCDGYAAYESLASKRGGVVLVSCLAHARRKFIESMPSKNYNKGIAAKVLKKIQRLYSIERRLKKSDNASWRLKIKNKYSRPHYESLFAVLEDAQSGISNKNKLGKAVAYTIKRKDQLLEYLNNGFYELDNNRAENAIRPIALGRKNYLFCKSVDGAHAHARLYSLISTVRACNLNEHDYLINLFTELPKCKSESDYRKLLPYNIDQTPSGD